MGQEMAYEILACETVLENLDNIKYLGMTISKDLK